MMTDTCNLRCPYCFANEFVNKDRNEITEENFDKAVSFILGDGTQNRIGLIGGEPTTHSRFDYFLRKLIANPKVESIVVYTNGILIDKYIDLLCHSKVSLLINCNPPSDTGEKAFKRLCDNIRMMVEERLCKDKITLGINMYSPSFEYLYILQMLKEYGFKHVRVSVTVPNYDAERNMDAHAYFNSMKPRVFEFFHALLANEIIPNFDCNKIPVCLISEDEYHQFDKYIEASVFLRENISRSNIGQTEVGCSPVIDIRQDLTAVRCFGLSEYTKTSIAGFDSIRSLELYYRNQVDVFAYNTVYSPKCVDCGKRKTLTCMGGCLAFKIAEIEKVRNYATKQMEKHICEEKVKSD